MINIIARFAIGLIFILFFAIISLPLFALTEREVMIAHNNCTMQGFQGYNNIDLPFGFTNMIFTVHCETEPMQFVESTYE